MHANASMKIVNFYPLLKYQASKYYFFAISWTKKIYQKKNN